MIIVNTDIPPQQAAELCIRGGCSHVRWMVNHLAFAAGHLQLHSVPKLRAFECRIR